MRNNSEIAKILSENDTLHRYGESQGEFFTNLIRDMADDLEADATKFEETRKKYHERARQKGHVHTEILGNVPLVEMYWKVWPLHDYFTSTKLFQPHWMKKSFMGKQGAVRKLSLEQC